MIHRDTLVGVVSIGAGLFILVLAWRNNPSIMSAGIPSLLVKLFGAPAAKVALIITGLAFVCLGACLLLVEQKDEGRVQPPSRLVPVTDLV